MDNDLTFQENLDICKREHPINNHLKEVKPFLKIYSKSNEENRFIYDLKKYLSSSINPDQGFIPKPKFYDNITFNDNLIKINKDSSDNLSFSNLLASLDFDFSVSEACLHNSTGDLLACKTINGSRRTRSNSSDLNEVEVEDGCILTVTRIDGESSKMEIRFVNSISFEEISDEPVWSAGLETEEVDIILERGWNLIGLPVMPVDDNDYEDPELRRVSSLFPESLAVYEYFHREDDNAGYNVLWNREDEGEDRPDAVLEPGKGYWVYWDKELTIISVSGKIVNDCSLKLYRGWNLIGGFGPLGQEVSLTFKNHLDNSEIDINKFYIYDSRRGHYEEVDSLSNKGGYWVKIEDEKVIFLGESME